MVKKHFDNEFCSAPAESITHLLDGLLPVGLYE